MRFFAIGMLEPGRTGRPLNLAWQLFLRVVDPETGRVRAECRGCGRNLVAQVRRMNAHIEWCTKLAGTAMMQDFESKGAELDAPVDAIDLLAPASPPAPVASPAVQSLCCPCGPWAPWR